MAEPNPELVGIASVILKNHFYAEFSSLVEKYVAAGLGREEMCEASSPYGTARDAEPDSKVSIVVYDNAELLNGRPFDTIQEAVQIEGKFIYIGNNPIFEWRDDIAAKFTLGWYFVGDQMKLPKATPKP